RWLLRGLVPSRGCWYPFRDRLGPALLGLAQQSVRQAIAEGFTTASRAAIDGTLVAANASRHKLLNEAVLGQRCRQLRQAVAADEAAAAGPPPPPAEATTAKAAAPQPATATDKAAAAAAPPRWLAATVRWRRSPTTLACWARCCGRPKEGWA